MLDFMKPVLLGSFLALALFAGGIGISPRVSAAQSQGVTAVPDPATLESFSSSASTPATANQQPTVALGPAVSTLHNVVANASILMYHHIAPPPSSLAPVDAQYFVAPTTFDSQLYYLVAHDYSVVPLERLVDAIHGGQPLPARTVAITIDDGWQDFWQNGLPVVKKYALPVTLFVIADADSHGYMSPNERWVLDHTGVDVEAHTLTHPYLSRVLPAQANSEIVNSKKALEKELGQPVHLFAYPYGDFNNLVMSMVQAAGYDAAFAASSGFEEDTQNILRLPRVAVGYYDTPDTFSKKIADYRWSRSHTIPMPPPPRPSIAVTSSQSSETSTTMPISPDADPSMSAPLPTLPDAASSMESIGVPTDQAVASP